MSKETKVKICPRCGLPYSYIEKRGKYYYAVHYEQRGEKRVKRRCYLGAENYVHVSHINEIRLTSKHLDPDFLFRLLNTTLDQLYDLSQRDEYIKNKLIEKLKSILKLLKSE